MLSEKDLKQIAQKGITQEQIENQLNEFKTGFPFLKPPVSHVVSSPPTPRHANNMRRLGKSIRLLANVW